VVIVDTPPTHEDGDLGLLAWLAFQPVIGDALWRIKPDFSVRKGLEVAFAPGFTVPDAFVEDVKRMTYSSYEDSAIGSGDYSKERGLDLRMRDSGKPLLVIMGAEEQIIDDPAARLAEYRATVPGVETELLPGVGHSPNVEAPARTAALILAFGELERPVKRGKQGKEMQASVQNPNAVRGRS
jgi:pimeloyl-ACP methyl ester carboxylesterase